MDSVKVILLACGSFNPPTNMHLRMFEIARDHLQRFGKYQVVGGIISPVHDSYGKKDLVAISHRVEMLTIALRTSDWIRLSRWESDQESWLKTYEVLQYHQNTLNSILNENQNNFDVSWLSDEILGKNERILIKLLCGADLLESFAVPGLWREADIERIIGDHGLVVISRQGTNPEKFIYESDLLSRLQHNISLVTEWITNDVSSTKIRRALSRQESVRYLINDGVLDYIAKHGLYGYKKQA